MQRISTLLQRLTELSAKEKDYELIDIDLMLDYTRVVYADLLELRKNVAINHVAAPPQAEAPKVTHAVAPVAATTERVIEAIVQQAPKEEVKAESVQVQVPPQVKYADVPMVDVRTHIGINDKYLYLSELFNNDKSAYDDAIKRLNTFTSLQDATKWMDKELAAKYNWDKESETVQSFYGLLSNCFLSM